MILIEIMFQVIDPPTSIALAEAPLTVSARRTSTKALVVGVVVIVVAVVVTAVTSAEHHAHHPVLVVSGKEDS